MQHFNPATDTAPDWDQMQPVLDEAMADLSDEDRDALLLRYFKNHDFRAIGSTLGVSDDAAQKRVTRALERLRAHLTNRGVTTTGLALSTALTANAVPLAPVGLAATLSTTALAGTTLAASATVTATKAIAMTTIQKTLVTAALAALASVGIYEARQASQLRDQNQTLQQQQVAVSEQIGQLQRERDEANNRLANLLADNSRLSTNSNKMELLRLRGQVARLRGDADQANDPVVKKALRWKANVEKMKLLFAEHPEQQVPEMKLLSDDYFFDLAKNQDLETTNGIRKAFSEIRMRAKNVFAPALQEAMNKFIQKNPGRQFENVLDLQSYFDPPVDESILQQYRVVTEAERTEFPEMTQYMVVGKPVVDADLDRAWMIGPTSYGQRSVPDALMGAASVMRNVLLAYRAANNGNSPTDPQQLKPYITTPEQEAAFDTLRKSVERYGKEK